MRQGWTRTLKRRYPVWGGARSTDVVSKLGLSEAQVWHAVETSTDDKKGRRYWWEGEWVGVNWWPRTAPVASWGRTFVFVLRSQSHSSVHLRVRGHTREVAVWRSM